MMGRRKRWAQNVGRIAATAVLSASIACAPDDSAAPGPALQTGSVAVASPVIDSFADISRHSPRVTDSTSDQAFGQAVQFLFSCNGIMCNFDASGSTDPAGIVRWSWNWGDGTTVVRTSSSAKKMFPRPGVYDVTLTITNGNGFTASLTRQAAIQPEPAGMTKLAETSFDCVTGCGQWSFFNPGYTDAATSIEDPAAPRSANGVVQLNYLPGLHPGTAPASFGVKLEQKQTLFVAIWIKVSANFQGHGSTVNKILHFWTKNGRNTMIFLFRGGGNSTLVPALAVQGLAASYQGRGTEVNFNPEPQTCTTPRGVWAKYEILLTNNTPGIPDGTADLWMNGTKCLQITGLPYVGAGQNNRWEEIWWSPTWGGAGGPTPAVPFSMSADHIYISGK